ncbi:hypothetical protein HW130_03245 [Streptomyces sp. PKU-EA00015]|uniref:hypothetical protein n=1 Tax=Streptomyces sp. PKU-EA00015 TaxID=2748326 RepID=UPI0015A4101C|nr:hypothetical protein [Streptomyces sp. PKU-EA00015]NWF25288.1 hypothetical protein [Streptomyces sp. PKU-EA00015]
MTRRLTVAERLASDGKNLLLADIVKQSEWSQFLVEQAVLHFGLLHHEFSANSLRDVLPELGHGYLGAAINSLRSGGIIEHTGRMVPSTSPATHGHRLAVWTLTDRGIQIARQRRNARLQQREAAA